MGLKMSDKAHLTTVAGLERFPTLQGNLLDTSVELRRCPMCDSVAGFRANPHGDIRAECSNTSCAIQTPYHYRTRETAAYAWNRQPGDPPKAA